MCLFVHKTSVYVLVLAFVSPSAMTGADWLT